MINLSGKNALITGSTRGIGKAIAYRLAQAGANVVITGTSEDRAKAVADEISKDLSIYAFGVGLNVSDSESVEEAVSKVEKEFGTVNILVNNAGITRDTLFMRMKLQDWEEVLRINLTGTFMITHRLIKGMMKARWGRIINISSVVGFTGNPGQVNYSTTKAGLIGFTKSLAKELAPRNITVNAVAPGFIDTDMTQVIPEDIKEKYLESIPMKRMGKPEEVADAVLFLASDMSSYITGEVIHVNGGMY